MDVTWRGERKRIRSPDNTIAGARAFEQLVRRTLSDTGSLDDLDPARRRLQPTFADFAERWMRDYAQVNNKPSEVRGKRQILRTSLLPAFGERRLREITPHAVEAFKAGCLARELSPKSVNNHLAVLRRALVIATEWGELASVPAMRFLPVSEKPVRTLDLDEVFCLASGAEGEPWRTMILIAGLTGLRFNELIALEWSDVDLDGEPPGVTVARGAVRGHLGPTKTYRVRRLPLPLAAADAFRAFPRTAERVFDYPGGFVPYTSARKQLRRAADRAGLPRIGWHVLRHTYLTELGRRGAPIHTMQRLAGHTTVQTTMRYAHVLPDMLASAVQLLERPHAPPGSPVPAATGGPMTPREQRQAVDTGELFSAP